MGADVSDESEAPGWHAIIAATARVYPGVEPLHLATIAKYADGGPDPLEAFDVFRSERIVPHWHFVTYGLSELFVPEKPSSDGRSGFGFELTMRVRREVEDESPPSWVFTLLQGLARYVFETQNVFGVGHHMNLDAPLAKDRDTSLSAIVFAREPELSSMTTPNGHVDFLQVVGVTEDELALVQRWNCERFLQALAERHPLFITDLARRSILGDATLKGELEARASAEPSTLGQLYVKECRHARKGAKVELTLEAKEIERIAMVLETRVARGAPLVVIGEGGGLAFHPSDEVAVDVDPPGVVIHLTPAVARALASQLRPRPGRYTFAELPGVTLVLM